MKKFLILSVFWSIFISAMETNNIPAGRGRSCSYPNKRLSRVMILDARSEEIGEKEVLTGVRKNSNETETKEKNPELKNEKYPNQHVEKAGIIRTVSNKI